MREQVKPRFAVDLDEIERQLAQAQSAPAPASQAHGSAPSRNDPLAELARIVGQDDPFQTLLSADRSQKLRHHGQVSVDDLYEPRAGHPADADLRGPSEQDSYAAHPGYAGFIISTLPAEKSRWLRMDLPRRLRAKYDLPVYHVVAAQEFSLADLP